MPELIAVTLDAPTALHPSTPAQENLNLFLNHDDAEALHQLLLCFQSYRIAPLKRNLDRLPASMQNRKNADLLTRYMAINTWNHETKQLWPNFDAYLKHFHDDARFHF